MKIKILRAVIAALKREKIHAATTRLPLAHGIFYSLYKWGFLSCTTYARSDEAAADLINVFPKFKEFAGECGLCEATRTGTQDNVPRCSTCPLAVKMDVDTGCTEYGSSWKTWTLYPSEEHAKIVLKDIEEVLKAYLVVVSEKGNVIASDHCYINYNALEELWNEMFPQGTPFYGAHFAEFDSRMRFTDGLEQYVSDWSHITANKKSECNAKAKATSAKVEKVKPKLKALCIPTIFIDACYPGLLLPVSGEKGLPGVHMYNQHVNECQVLKTIDRHNLKQVYLVECGAEGIEKGDFYFRTNQTLEDLRYSMHEGRGIADNVYPNIAVKTTVSDKDVSYNPHGAWGASNAIPRLFSYIYKIIGEPDVTEEYDRL